MSTTAINGGTGAVSALSSLSGTSATLGKDDFLKLLVSQLQNQDPLNPSDATEFTAQLAQFSSLEQLSNINKALEQLSSAQNLGAMSCIGRDVVLEDSYFELGSGGVDLGYRLDGDADQVALYLQDGYGRTVAAIPASELAAGEHYLNWDGKDASGQTVPAGTYRLLVAALRGEDQVVAGTSLVKAQVTGVDLSGSEPQLVTGAGQLPLSQVSTVSGG